MSFVGDFVLIEVICQKNSKLNEPYQVEFFKKATLEMYIPDMKKIYRVTQIKISDFKWLYL